MVQYPVTDNGSSWIVNVNPDVSVEFEAPWNSVQGNKSEYIAGLGYKSTPPAGYKIVYLKFPKGEWSKEWLESDDYQQQLSLMVNKCHVCATLNTLRNGTDNGQVVNTPMPKETQVAAAIPTMQPASRLTAGSVITPSYVPKVAKLVQKGFCTTLGETGLSVLGSLVFDIMSGWTSDPGQKMAMQQISDQLVDLDLCPEDMAKMRTNAQEMYKAWQQDGTVAAVKKGFFKSFDQAISDGIGVQMDTKTIKKTTRNIGIRKGIAGSLVVE